MAVRDGPAPLNAQSTTSLQTPPTPVDAASAATPDESEDESDGDAPDLWSSVAPSQSPEKSFGAKTPPLVAISPILKDH